MTTVQEQRTQPLSWAERISEALTLRRRILLLLCVAALPGIAVAVYLAANSLDDQTRQIETSVDRLARLGAAQHESVLGNARILLEAVARGQNLDRIEAAQCQAYLSDWVDKFGAFTSLTLFDMSGDVVCSNLESELPFTTLASDWFERLRRERDFVLGSYAIGKTGNPLVIAAYPVAGTDEPVIGAVAVGIDLRWLDFIGRTVQLPDNGTITAINSEGQILSHNTVRDTDREGPVPARPSKSALSQMTAVSGGTLRAADAAGNPRLYGFQNTLSGDVIVAVGLPPYLESAQYGEALRNTLTAPLMILVLTLLAAAYASEAFVTRYVRALTRTAETIAEGDLSIRSEIPYDKYEIGRLAAAFDEMAESIESNQTELRDLAEQRETLVRELNHRVKNNLQIVLSLLHVEGREVTGETAQERLKSLAGRVRTLAEIHHLLYRHFDDNPPHLAAYIEQLSALFAEFYDLDVKPVAIDPAIGSMELKLGQAIAVGLILNELVANARKHAYPDGAPGHIRVRILKEEENNRQFVHLIAEDEGVGVPEDFDFAAGTTTGMRIVNALARQLDGRIWCERLPSGTEVHLRFSPTAPTRQTRSM